MTPDKHDLQFAAEVSCRYHRRRATFLARLDSVINWLTLIVSASAFLLLAGGENAPLVKTITAVVAILTITQIGFGLGKAVSKHEVWHVQWCDLLAEIQTCADPEPVQLNAWIVKRKKIEAEYPHELTALAVECRNRAIEALDLEDEELREIYWWQRPFLQIIDLQGTFPKRAKLNLS